VSWTEIRASVQLRGTSLIWYSLGLAVYSWFIVSYYPQFAGNEEFLAQVEEVMSSEMLAAFGAEGVNLGSLGGFLGVEYLSLIWVVIAGSAVIAFAAKAMASDISAGTMEVTLTQPVSRLTVAFSRYVSLIIYAVVINLATVVPIYVACQLYDIEVDRDAMVLLFALGLILTLAIGGFAYMVSSFSTGGGRVAAVTGGVLAAMWLANFVSAVNESTEFLDKLTLFYYWEPDRIIDEATTMPEAWWVFGVAAVVFAAIAVWRFLGRDIAA
jgi:ABC-2 type transport system permease protein